MSTPIILTAFELEKIERELPHAEIERVYDQSHFNEAVRHKRRINGDIESVWGQGRQLYVVIRRGAERVSGYGK